MLDQAFEKFLHVYSTPGLLPPPQVIPSPESSSDLSCTPHHTQTLSSHAPLPCSESYRLCILLFSLEFLSSVVILWMQTSHYFIICSHCSDLALPSPIFIQALMCFRWGESSLVLPNHVIPSFFPLIGLGNEYVMRFWAIMPKRRSVGRKLLGGKMFFIKDMKKETSSLSASIPHRIPNPPDI